jgi:stress-induced morphogen
MIDPGRLEELVLAHLPGAELALEDLTGTRDHYRLRVVSERFSGLNPLQQHRLVYAALQEQMGGAIHALALDTFTPEAWAKRGG